MGAVGASTRNRALTRFLAVGIAVHLVALALLLALPAAPRNEPCPARMYMQDGSYLEISDTEGCFAMMQRLALLSAAVGVEVITASSVIGVAWRRRIWIAVLAAVVAGFVAGLSYRTGGDAVTDASSSVRAWVAAGTGLAVAWVASSRASPRSA